MGTFVYWVNVSEKFCADFYFSISDQMNWLEGISALGLLAMGTEMSQTGSDSNQDNKGAHLSVWKWKCLSSSLLATWGKVLPFLTSRLDVTFCSGNVFGGEGDISKKNYRYRCRTCKPWDKISRFEKETRWETRQCFMMRHIQDTFPEAAISMQEARGQDCQTWDFVTVNPKQRGWVWSRVPNGNNGLLIWDSFSQTSRTIETNGFKGQGDRQCWERQRTQGQALGLPSPQRKLTTTKVARSNLIRTILQRSWAISVVLTEFLLHCSLCHKSTTDLAKQMIFLKRIIYGGLAISRVILQWEVIMEIPARDSFLLTSVWYLLPLESDHLKSFTVQGEVMIKE